MKTACVVTVTSGRESLERACASVDSQTYPVHHHIVTDGVLSLDDYVSLSRRWTGPRRQVSYWAGRVWTRNVAGARLYAAVPPLVNEDVIFYLNDDDWYEPDHVEALMALIEQGCDWAYSFRKIYDVDGTYIDDDVCESLGEAHDVWNWEGMRFAETSSTCFRTPIMVQMAQIYGMDQWGSDRMTYQTAKTVFPNFACSKKHSLCYSLGGNKDSVTKEFIEAGNKAMRARYPDGLPWVNR